ncbi:FAS1 domain-containing protein SELMODRAFT_448915-like [Salvia miltiorrhiza]|uniref:FAS1 domain-containing protein SELMODRAFT_448915-like n=1 Tax=Salvia miltiorrhiza TaxID=226208 RepID=UPI0025AC50AC|nr:FAS1 domain-containing protein SELMODRAFT_448915-like [Salvia miltiorrhiza]
MALFLVLTIFSMSVSLCTSMNQDMISATKEMQKANYFTFVMLLNMAPPDAFNGNITFLMPNDRSLAAISAGGVASVLDFLLRQSIPSPLLLDHLNHFPTGSMIPASKPGFMFKVSNDGRKRFFLSNVRITSPNICTKGNSVRCHGIDGVAEPAMVPLPDIPPTTTPTCVTPVDRLPPPIAASSPSAVAQVSRQKSSSCSIMVVDLVTILAVMMISVYPLFV